MTQGRVVTHHDLDVWKQSMELVQRIYEVTRGFPVEERFGLTLQMRRAAISAPSNIAEGASRIGRREFVHFLAIARSSLAELETQCMIASRLGYFDSLQSTSDHIERVRRMINGLMRSLSHRRSP